MEPAYAGAAPTGSAYAPEGAYARATMYPATPDGQFLAGWWQRVWAYLLDAIVVGIIGGILASPWIGDLLDAYREFSTRFSGTPKQVGRPPTRRRSSSRSLVRCSPSP
jgi:hypothetical protein